MLAIDTDGDDMSTLTDTSELPLKKLNFSETHKYSLLQFIKQL